MANLNRKSQIKVVNNCLGSASFIGMDGKKYLFARKGAFRLVELEILEALYNENPNFITEGYIIFEDKRVYEFLEIPEDIYSKLIPIDAIPELLEKGEEELKEILTDAPTNIKENVAVVAKEKKIDSKKKIRAIKEVTGFDVEINEDDEE